MYGPHGFPANAIDRALAPGERYFYSHASDEADRPATAIRVPLERFEAEQREGCFTAVAFFDFDFAEEQFRGQGLSKEELYDATLQDYRLQSNPVRFCME